MSEVRNIKHDSDDERQDRQSTFIADHQLFGLPISGVVQIIAMQALTPVPEFPNYAKGIINLRGVMIPAIDMRLRLHKEAKEYHSALAL